MNKDLEKRFADIRSYLNEEFKSKETKWWWQQPVNDYIPTRDMGGGKNYYPQNQEETIVKYDFKRALNSGALFFIVTFLMTFFLGDKREAFTPIFWMMNIIGLLAVCWPLIRGKKRGPLIIFNKEGFRIGNMPVLVSWEYLAVSYIRKDVSGEDPSYYLLLFYNEETTDEFKEIEYSIGGLDMGKDDIAAQIEYWRMKTVSNRI